MKYSPIGVFDSGIGGLTVLKEIHELLPNESVIYFGDTARVPYGNKGDETITRYALENANFFKEKGVKCLVIACNTVTAIALDIVQETLQIPVIGVIEPAVEEVLFRSKTPSIVVLATEATINSNVYQQKIRERAPNANVLGLPCPLFVPLAEEGWQDHPIAIEIAKEYLHPLQEKKSIEMLLLGCTHYPLLRKTLSQVVGKEIEIIDSAKACAQSVKDVLERHGLKNEDTSKGVLEYYVSDAPQKFRDRGVNFFMQPLNEVHTFLTDLCQDFQRRKSSKL